MTEPPSSSPWGPEYDDRRVHAARAPHGPTPPHDTSRRPPEAPFEGPLHLLSRTAWQAVMLAGVTSLVLGALVLAWPGASLLAAGVLFGLYLLVSGVLQLASAFGTHTTTSLRVMAFVSGALSVLLGLFCFRDAMRSVLLLALWVGIGWLFRGLTQTLAAASDRTMPARDRQILLGVVGFLAGVVLIVFPFESVAVLTLVSGCLLIVVGVAEIVTAVRIRERVHRVPRAV
ncbi:HdeD family acid-resistance protein [Streptomyces spongiae]|uniref:HdeD family acid-resistance protein n=1 Tax=Streptomyces spongiae TaxID=565072 RepID=A0A5N8XZI8_9ACTN|nr:HdeD family acid-resistance protein [Streptomyces spongiae]MPY64790.1 HdeD family acid-resistance protein [Streptomyces spongiae]